LAEVQGWVEELYGEVRACGEWDGSSALTGGQWMGKVYEFEDRDGKRLFAAFLTEKETRWRWSFAIYKSDSIPTAAHALVEALDREL